MGNYNLIRYGLKQQRNARRTFSVSTRLKMISVHGGKDISCNFLPAEQLTADATSGLGVPSTFVKGCNLTVTINITPTIPRDFIATSELNIYVDVFKDISRKLTLLGTISCIANTVKDLSMSISVSDGLSLYSQIVKDIFHSILCTSGIYLFTDAAFIDVETITINVGLPAGGVLRIDTNNYAVTMNGQNMLHLQVGEWVKLSRETQDISVSSGTGGRLEGDVIMTEIYL